MMDAAATASTEIQAVIGTVETDDPMNNMTFQMLLLMVESALQVCLIGSSAARTQADQCVHFKWFGLVVSDGALART